MTEPEVEVVTMVQRLRDMARAPSTHPTWSIKATLTEAADLLASTRYAHVKVSEFDVIYGVLDEVRDKVTAENVSQEQINAEVDAVLAQFSDPADLWQFGASTIEANTGGKVDDDHDWWQAEEPDTEAYVERRVKEILGL